MGGRRTSGYGVAPMWQDPARTREVAGVSVRVVLQVVLVLRLGLPERPRLGDLGDDLAGPESGGLDVGDGVLGDPSLLVIDVEDGRSIAHAHVVPLAVEGRRVMDLEEELEDLSVRGALGVKGDLDRLGVGAVVSIGGVRHVAAGITDPGREHARALADQVLHPPKTASGQDRLLRGVAHWATSSFVSGL